jgi:hypothetical protein
MLETSFRSFFGQASGQIILREQVDSGGVLQHLTHLEELILTSKMQGLNLAIEFLKQLWSTLKGNTDSKTFVSIKFDGAPSVIAGYNPQDKKFFVSTKSIGNVNPKINYSPEDVDKNHGHAPGLAEKLKLALNYLPSVIRSGIYQGDFMFDQRDLKRQNIEGEDLILFKPNTITYAVEQHSPLGQRILSSKIGVIFHTKYSGINLQSLKKSSNVNVSEFNQTADVFVDDAKFKDISGMATFTNEESENLQALIDSVSAAGNQIEWDSISDQIYTYLNTFINSLVRQSKFVQNPQKEYEAFVTWIETKGKNAVESMKTTKGKERKQQALSELVSTIQKNKLNILNLLNLTKKLEQAKRIFIEKYNSAIKTKQFLTQPDGTLKVSAPEGYVAVDHSGNMVKFVDRLSFSAANFVASKAEKFK